MDLGVTTESTGSSSESSGAEMPPPAPVRLAKRKPSDGSGPTDAKRQTTYYLRKDEIASLQDQVKSLTEKLAKYEREARIAQASLSTALAANELMSQRVEENTLRVAGTQSMVSAYNLAMVQANGVVPLQSYVHLPADPRERQQVMDEMFTTKLGAAVRFMAERTRFLDLRVRHRQTEQFELPNGEVTVVTMDVTQFDSGHSVRQVYDAFMYFVVNQEISISEKLGVLTVRESEEVEHFKCCQTRFLSTVRGGLEVESNAVAFATCIEATDQAPGYAAIAMDFVDLDDLHPYRPEICVQKEVTGAITLNEIPSRTGGPPTIAMARWSHVRVPPPTFKLSQEAEKEVRSGMLQWCDIVSTIMRERLSTIPPAPNDRA